MFCCKGEWTLSPNLSLVAWFDATKSTHHVHAQANVLHHNAHLRTLNGTSLTHPISACVCGRAWTCTRVESQWTVWHLHWPLSTSLPNHKQILLLQTLLILLTTHTEQNTSASRCSFSTTTRLILALNEHSFASSLMHRLLDVQFHQAAGSTNTPEPSGESSGDGFNSGSFPRYVAGASLVAGVLFLSCLLKFCRRAVVPFVKRRLCGIDPSPIPPPPITVRERSPTNPNRASETATFIKELPEIRLQNEEDKEEDCPICMDTLGDQLVSSGPCKHYFHSVCLKNWLSVDGKLHCPICRMGVHPTMEQPETTETIQTTRGTQTTTYARSSVDQPSGSESAGPSQPTTEFVQTSDASTTPSVTANNVVATALTTTSATAYLEAPAISQTAPT